MDNAYPAHSQLVNLFATAARTSTTNGTGVDVSGLEGLVEVVLDSAAGSGTTPTMDVKLQSSADNSTGWTDVGGAVFTQVAGTASQQKIQVNISKAKKYVRAVATIAGTTPSFTASVNMLGCKQYYP